MSTQTVEADATTQPNFRTFVRDADGNVIGKIVCQTTTYKAVRKTGTRSDFRKMAQGFRTIRAAEAWVMAASAAPSRSRL